MAIEKPFYTTPASLAPQEEAINIVIENPEAVSMVTEDGGVIVDFDPTSNSFGEEDHYSNLAEFLSDEELMSVASELVFDFNSDRESRSDWEKTYVEGIKLLGLKFEDRTTPWDGACGVFHPMLSESIVRFQSQTIQEIFPAQGPAKTKIEGASDIKRSKQALRIKKYLNYVSTEQMVEYRSETEKLLFSLPVAGSAFRKVYFDDTRNRPVSMFIPAEDFVVSYGASDLETCERMTHVMKRTPNHIRKLQVSGFYRDVFLPKSHPDYTEIEKKNAELEGRDISIDSDDRHTLLEMHVEIDLPGYESPDGIALPYVITIDKQSKIILSIYRNWKEGDPNKIKRQHFVHYNYLPGLGFYGFGLVHMIGGLSKSATSLLRQLVDAGTLSNLPGGLKTRGLRIKGDDSPIMPGEFRDVDVPSGSIRDNISFMPYKEPSNVLYQLLGDIVQEGRRFASAADVKASDINGEAPVGTTLAVLEREMKVMSAIQARVHEAMGRELRLLGTIIYDFGPENYPYDVEGEYTIKEDFDDRIDIIPVSDPNAGTMAQRIMQYQAALQLSAQAPQMYDLPLLHRDMLEALGISQADKIVPTDDDIKPKDPVSENMSLLNGEPVKAFAYQDHEAHIQVHMSMQNNPQIVQTLGKAPNAKAIQAATMSHIAEHVAFAYRRKIEEQLGMSLPPENEQLPENLEFKLSQLVAPAAAQVTGQAQKLAKAKENAKKSQDPIFLLQKEELEIKKQKAQADLQKVQADMQIKEDQTQAKFIADMQKHRDQMEFEYAKLEQERETEIAKLATKTASDNDRIKIEELKIRTNAELEGFRKGIDFFEKEINNVNNRRDKT
jgi:hypothetical protein